MGRTAGAKSHSTYHYKVEYLNKDRESFITEYYKTSKEVQEKLKISDSLVYEKTKDINHISRIKRLNDINILKCNIPVYNKVIVKIEY